MRSSSSASRSTGGVQALWALGPKRTLSRTESQGNSVGSWKIMPRSAPGAWMMRPPAVISPRSDCKKPPIRLSRVDFPQPDGPTRQAKVPARIDSDTFRRAACGSSARVRRKNLLTFLTSISTPAVAALAALCAGPAFTGVSCIDVSLVCIARQSECLGISKQSRRTTGVQKNHIRIGLEATLADEVDEAGHGLAGVDRIQKNALELGQHADCIDH